MTLAVALILTVALPLVIVAAGTAWDSHARYGPIIAGNTRWRREAPQRAAQQAQREALAALTDDDRAWLAEMGWRP